MFGMEQGGSKMKLFKRIKKWYRKKKEKKRLQEVNDWIYRGE
jgi:hypothetical protein